MSQELRKHITAMIFLPVMARYLAIPNTIRLRDDDERRYVNISNNDYFFFSRLHYVCIEEGDGPSTRSETTVTSWRPIDVIRF
jgi:hypothetical protein